MASWEPVLCYHCGRETEMPFRCSYCNLTFCGDHRIPEMHNCIRLPGRSWSTYKRTTGARLETGPKISPKYVVAAIVIVIIVIYILSLWG